MQRSKNDVWVGLFVLIGAVALLFLALQSANLLTLSFQKSYRVDAKRPCAVPAWWWAGWKKLCSMTNLSKPV